jgi:hypothetical protein
MHVAQTDDGAVAEANAGVDGRHVALYDEPHLRVDEFEAGEEHHPVVVVLGMTDSVRIPVL